MKANTVAILDDNQSIQFSELNNIIGKTAQYYFENGVFPKNNIAILGFNSIEYVITIFALWKIGAIPVPINTRLNESEINSIIESSKCSKIILESHFAETTTKISEIEMAIKYSGNNYKAEIQATENDTAVIIHTSGSSGVPKGVETTNENLFQSYLASANAFHFSSDDIFLASLPFYHIGGFSIINRALLSGGTLVLPKSLKQEDIVNAMQKYNVSVVSLVPTMMQRIIESGIKPNSNLKCLFLGGGASSDELIASALNKKWQVVKVYGSSETTAMVTACWNEELRNNPKSAGKPLLGVEIKIFDENYNSVDVGKIGEIAIKSKTIAKGYLNLDELWKQKIHNGFYLSGDFGYLDETGKLFVVARRTDLIVSGGENIDPREIEIILNAHPQINESYIFPIEDKIWGEIAVALIVTNSSLLTENDIFEYLRLKIASYKIPKRIKFVSEIPKTELGKIKIDEAKQHFI